MLDTCIYARGPSHKSRRSWSTFSSKRSVFIGDLPVLHEARAAFTEDERRQTSGQCSSSAYPRIPSTLRGWRVVSRGRGTKNASSLSTVRRADCSFPGPTVVVSSFVRAFSLAKPEAVRKKRSRQARPKRWTTSCRSLKPLWRRLALPWQSQSICILRSIYMYVYIPFRGRSGCHCERVGRPFTMVLIA